MAIPKTSKKAALLLESAANVKVYALSNCFEAQPLSDSLTVWGGPIVNNRFTQLVPVSVAEFLRRELDGRSAKLYDHGNGKYHVNVHSNLWYEFESAA